MTRGVTGKGVVVLEKFAKIQDPEVGRRQGALALPVYWTKTLLGLGAPQVGDCLVPVGQAFQTSSFTLPTVVSGSKDMVLLRPEIRRNVR